MHQGKRDSKQSTAIPGNCIAQGLRFIVDGYSRFQRTLDPSPRAGIVKRPLGSSKPHTGGANKYPTPLRSVEPPIYRRSKFSSHRERHALHVKEISSPDLSLRWLKCVRNITRLLQLGRYLICEAISWCRHGPTSFQGYTSPPASGALQLQQDVQYKDAFYVV